MDLESRLDDLLNRAIDGKYLPLSLIKETSKSWVFKAKEVGEITSGRTVALKVLKPGLGEERRAQFIEEVKRRGTLSEHPKVSSLFRSGKYSDYF